ncbi:MAG: LD-carboxypeptidase [Ferruginibacter sp.]|nr:LD-carboxypeptidase [Ferruginibacter sp.]
MTIFPPTLRKGDTIGIMCPAGYMPIQKAEKCIQTLQLWGYKVVVGKTLNSKSKNYFSGTDKERLAELQQMLDNKEVNAILFGRGGYGMGRIIDNLNFSSFKKAPKWLIGFSDITILHQHLLNKYNISSIHGPMAALFNDGKAKSSIIALQKTLQGKKQHYKVKSNPSNKQGNITGVLTGGNLALLCNIIGTLSDFNVKNKILFIEDVGEYRYALDRMLWQIKRSGKLNEIAGLILGEFSDMKDTQRPFGKSIHSILKEWAAELNCPVCFNFPIGHKSNNFPVKQGAVYSLSINSKSVFLKEL